MQLPVPGELFDGRYHVESVLGEGGFATVYEAVAQRTGRRVALKALKARGARYDAETFARFQREVLILARLRHPHIVELLEYRESATGVLYMVFELVGGQDLSALLETHGTLDSSTVAAIMKQVLRALHEAHTAGLLHRDIKPQNIRVLGGPHEVRAKLLDFGVARATTRVPSAEITAAGDLVGTPRYMSPEQLRFQDLTPASDIYSLGVVAYEMLMGAGAMHGHRLTDQIERVAMTGMLVVGDEADVALRDVVQRMLQRSVEARFGSAAEVLEALGERVAQVTVVTPREPASTQALGAAPRVAVAGDRPAWSYVVVAMVVLLVVATTLSLASDSFRPSEPEPTLPGELFETTDPIAPLQPAVDPADSVIEVADVRGDVGPDLPPDLGPPAPRRSSGCGKDLAPRGKHEFPFRSRRVLVYIPKTYDSERAYPIVLMYHDTDKSTANRLEDESKLSRVADREGVIFAIPKMRAFADDIRPGESRRVVEDVGEVLCIDPSTVYAVGFGGGGVFAERLPCEMPNIGAIATVSYRSGAPLACTPTPPVPYIHFVGREDRHLPEDGGGCSGQFLTLDQHEELWRTQNQCSADSPTASKHRGGRCRTWQCAAPFASCIVDGGRGWMDRTDRGIYDMSGCDGPRPTSDMASEIWKFFAKIQSQKDSAK